MTKKQKHIAAAMYPTYGGYSTWPEVKKAKIIARGKYWNDTDYLQWVAFSPNGKRVFFDYDDEWKNDVKKCAILWSRGKIKEAKKLYDSFWDGRCFKNKDNTDSLKEKLKNIFK